MSITKISFNAISYARKMLSCAVILNFGLGLMFAACIILYLCSLYKDWTL